MGLVVSVEGVKLDPDNDDKIKRLSAPRNITNVRCLLGITGYYRRFIKGYSNLVRPLVELTRLEPKHGWNDMLTSPESWHIPYLKVTLYWTLTPVVMA